MECRTTSGEPDSATGPISVCRMPPDCHPFSQEIKDCDKTQNPDLVDSEEVGTVSVKQEAMDDETSKGDSQTFSITSNLPNEQASMNGDEPTQVVWPGTSSQTCIDTDTCPSYGDNPTTGTSYPLEEPSIHPMKEETLLTYENPAGVEEHDPLADSYPAFSPDSACSAIVKPEKQSLQPWVITIKTTQQLALEQLEQIRLRSARENFLKRTGIKGLNFASLTKSGASKLPDPAEEVKSNMSVEPMNSHQENTIQEPGTYSIQTRSDATVSNAEKPRLQTITKDRFERLLQDFLPTSLVALPLSALRERCKGHLPKSPTAARMKKGIATRSKSCRTTLNTQEKKLCGRVLLPSTNCPSLFYDEDQLDACSKSIVYNVANYFQEKKNVFSLSYNVENFASCATGLPKETVQKITSMGCRSLQDDKTLKFPTFGRYHTEKCKNCGDVLVDFALREIIFNGFVEDRKALTIKEISANLDDEEMYVCQDFLRRRLGELGIDRMRCSATSGYVPLERPELTASRYRYLRDIEKQRISNKEIVYVFETDLSKVVHGKVTWEPLEGHPTKDDSHLITVIHAAKESGFIDGCLFVRSDSSKQPRKSMHPLTMSWLDSFLPKLSRSSVVVLGHYRHHFVRPAEPKPDASWPKQDIVEWLHNHQQESFSSLLPSAVLLEKVNTIDVGSTFGVDDLIISHGHIPLHLPQNHRELNPVELVWRKILEKFLSVSIESEEGMNVFLQNEFDSISSSELQEAFQLSKNHEKRLSHLDMRIDEPVGEVIRRVGGILDRNYALAENESGDEDPSTDQIQDGLLEKVAWRSSEACKKKYENHETSLVQPGKKKRKNNWTQCAMGGNDQILQRMSQIRPSSEKDSQKISCVDDVDNSQLKDLGGNLRTFNDMALVLPGGEVACQTEKVGCIVGSNDCNSLPLPQITSHSWNYSEETSSDTSDEKQMEQSQLNISSTCSLSVVNADGVRIPTDSEATESVDWSDAEPTLMSPSDWGTESVEADACDITLRNPIKEEICEDMFWEPTCKSLTPWSNSLTESVTALEPPLPHLKEVNPRMGINYVDSNEENPDSVGNIGRGREIPHSENVDVKDNENSTSHNMESSSTDDPLKSELFRNLKTLITQPHTLQNSDVLRDYIRLEYKRKKYPL